MGGVRDAGDDVDALLRRHEARLLDAEEVRPRLEGVEPEDPVAPGRLLEERAGVEGDFGAGHGTDGFVHHDAADDPRRAGGFQAQVAEVDGVGVVAGGRAEASGKQGKAEQAEGCHAHWERRGDCGDIDLAAVSPKPHGKAGSPGDCIVRPG